MLYISPQGNVRQVELVMPTGLTQSDYVSLNVTVTGNGWELSQNLTRSDSPINQFLAIEVSKLIFNDNGAIAVQPNIRLL